MSAASAAALPSAREWRVWVRRARRDHHARSLGDVLTDVYMLLWLFLVYGGALVASVHRHLQHPSGTPFAGPEPFWVGVSVLLVGSGLVWQALRAVGPLMATPAEQAWGISTPVSRRAWLSPRFVALVLSTSVGLALVAAAVSVLGLHHNEPGWAALAAGAYGAAGIASLVSAQTPGGWRWPRLAGGVLIGVGVLVAGTVVTAHYLGHPFPTPGIALAPALALTGVPLCILALAFAWRSLPRVDMAALSAGAEVATATMSATVWLDPSLLSGVLEVRRWRHVGTVRSRPFHGGPWRRTWVLLQAELRRQLRRPGAMAVWGGLALALYALTMVAPSAVGVGRLLLGYVAAGRLMSGLRTLSSSPGLRRALGGSGREQRIAHLVVPALGMVLWWAATAPAGGVQLDVLELLLIAGVVGAAFRAATRPPMSYGGFVLETPFGLIPMELVLQLARGPDLLGGVIVLRLLFGR
ncbi:MAG: DUF6297 family protein [Gemmatimonadetes bacterium]|nr:DUF6297 family protein [Gemmatimonadota bacterium]